MTKWNSGERIDGVEGDISTDSATLGTYSRDYGNVVEARPSAVLKARTSRDVAEAIRHCDERGIGAVARGHGLSGNGQSLGKDALIIDMTGLDSVDEVSEDRVVIGAGARWTKLYEHCVVRGLTSPVFTNHLEVTVGGSLTFGGVGAESHRYGLQADHVIELELALVTGEVVTCSRAIHPELFHAALAGLGQFGFMTKVTLVPAPAPQQVVVANVVFEDAVAQLDEVGKLARHNRIDSVDCYAMAGTPPTYVAEVGMFAYGDEKLPDIEATLASCRGRIEMLRTMDYESYVFRLKPLISSLPPEMAKPWATYILHPRHAGAFARDHLEKLIVPERGTIVGLVQPICTRAAKSTTFAVPRESSSVLMGLGLVRRMDPAGVDEVLAEHRELFEKCIAVGGSIYPYGSVPLHVDDWRDILGANGFELYARLKRKYDPNGTLNPSISVGAAVLGA